MFKICVQKFLDERIVEALHFVRRADGENAAFVDDGDAVGHAEREVAVVRHHQRRDVNALAGDWRISSPMTTAESGSSSLVGSS